MLRIVKLLRSEVSAEVGDTLNFTSRVNTILHSGTAVITAAVCLLMGILMHFLLN